MNKTTRNYFINLFKRKKRILALYTFVVFMAFPFLLITDLITNDGYALAEITMVIFVLCLLSLGALAIILPLFTFRFAFVKKHVDTYFAIPMNRRHLFKAHFIAPILGTIIPITLSYLLGGLLLIPKCGVGVYFELLLVLILAFIIFIVIYSMNTFFILKCNNVLDASLISAAIGIIPILLYSATYTFLRSQIVNNGMTDNFIAVVPQTIIELLSPYNGLILALSPFSTRGGNYINISFDGFDYVLFFYYVVIGILFMIQAYRSFRIKKGEEAEQLSTHFLTYPLLSNAALIALILNFNFTEYDLTTSVLIMIALFVVYMIINGIAHRSFKINMKMIIKFIVIFIAINTFNVVSKETEFFGINRKVIDYTKYEEVHVNYYFYSYDDEKYGEESLQVIIDTKNISENEQKLLNYFEVLQKTKSLAHKQDDYDTLYPSDPEGDYSMSIYYDEDKKRDDDNSEYVHYQLDSEQGQMIRDLINKINERFE